MSRTIIGGGKKTMVNKKYFFISLALILLMGLALTACGQAASTTSTVAPASTTATSAPAASTESTAASTASGETTTLVAASGPAQTLKIGLVNDLTGFLSTWMLLENKMVQLQAQVINDNGGITVQGQKYNIEMVTEDSASTTDGAAAATNKLVFDDKVKFVIGGLAFENAAIGPITEQNKVLHVIFDATPDPAVVGPKEPYTFVGTGSTVEHMVGMANALKKEFPAAKNVLIVTQDDGSQVVTVPFMVKTLTGLGLTAANSGKAVVFGMQMEDFTPVANQINSAKPDAVIFINAMQQAVTGVTKGLRALGNNAPVVCQAFPADINGFISAIGTSGATNVLTLSTLRDDPSSPAAFKALEAKVPAGQPISFNQSADLQFLLQAIQKADSLDVDAVKAAWESMGSTDGMLGKTTVAGTQTFGIAGHALSASVQYTKIMDGKVATVDNDWITYDPIP